MTRAGREQQEIARRIRQRFERDAERILAGRGRQRSFDRRTFVLGTTASGMMFTRALSASAQEGTPSATPVASPASAGISSDPFTLGIASGEPVADGVVLWTRIAPRPFEPDGGVAAGSLRVSWEVASDEAMTRIVQQGEYATDAAWAHSVHAEVSGLEPATEYWYRFRVGDFESPVGRTKTAPAPGDTATPLRFAFASCQRWEHGLYTAFADLAAQTPDLVVHLGDYIYEYPILIRGDLRDVPARSTEGIPLGAMGETTELDDYRQRYAIYKRDEHLQAAHEVAPWIVTWDDHEVANNYFGQVVRDSPFSRPMLERRAAAYQAYWEHMPLRESARPTGPDLTLYRAAAFGDLVRFNVLDTRQYRTAQGGMCAATEREENDGYCAKAFDPERTLLGAEQKAWLLDGFGQTTARWNIIAQQVPFARIDLARDPALEAYGDDEMDKWDAYAGEREEVLAAMADAATAQGFHPIVITGDVHVNQAWDLKRDWDAAGDDALLGTEFVGTSISSNGDAALEDGGFTTVCGGYLGNEHNRLYDNHRGYVLVDVDADRMHTTYRGMTAIEVPDGEALDIASFVVEHATPGAREDGTCTPS